MLTVSKTRETLEEIGLKISFLQALAYWGHFAATGFSGRQAFFPTETIPVAQ
jgi:hypothetical protein